MSVEVSCPGCGAVIEFKVGSAIVAVCPYCRSAVARGDRRVEDLGKVAALVDTDSLLAVGLRGRYQGVPFDLTGRTQLGHVAGGVWDEWYAHFADGRWGWLAEANGHFYLTFEHKINAGSLPPFDRLELGRRFKMSGAEAPLLVAEKGEARALGAEGEIPFRLQPGATYEYADLSGPKGEFGTLDYSEDPPLLFLGREVTLDDLDLPATVKPARRERRQVAGAHLSCPHCGGALELRAPDKTERVTCPSCGSLLDVNQGQLVFLKALEPTAHEPAIPLGSAGKLDGQDWTVIGFMVRSVLIEGTHYPWDEYLLYHERDGFRWLTRSDDHWNFVETLPPGAVSREGKTAVWEGQTFRLFQKAPAYVDHVLGEFYWKVEVGEEVQTADFIQPPLMLSREVTHYEGQDKGEVNWSLGRYLPVADVEKAFGVSKLPRPLVGSVAPNQPFLYWRMYLYWGLFAGLGLLLYVLVCLVNRERVVYEKSFQVTAGKDPAQAQVFFSEPFELSGWHNLHVSMLADLDNSWVELEGDLINEDTQVTQPFFLAADRYSGVEDGEAWSEGSGEASEYLSAPQGGKYTLRLEFLREVSATPGVPGFPGQQPTPRPTTVRVRIEQGVAHFLPWFVALVVLSLIPLAVLAYHVYFVKRRWDESQYSLFGSK